MTRLFSTIACVELYSHLLCWFWSCIICAGLSCRAVWDWHFHYLLWTIWSNGKQNIHVDMTLDNEDDGRSECETNSLSFIYLFFYCLPQLILLLSCLSHHMIVAMNCVMYILDLCGRTIIMWPQKQTLKKITGHCILGKHTDWVILHFSERRSFLQMCRDIKPCELEWGDSHHPHISTYTTNLHP